jgi:hypothetical protein
MDAIEKAFGKGERNSEVMGAFGIRLRNQFSQNKAYRRPKELEWLESLRQIKGLYDPDVKIDKNNSKVYPKITRSKINIVLSRLHEMLFPEIDKNWEINPTPEPRISKEVVTQIAMSLIKPPPIDPETGQVALDPLTGQPAQPIMPTIDDLQIAIKKYAKETCAKMSSEIDDQLTEMDYPEETKKVLRSGLQYGTGVMKGPMVSKRTKRTWHPIQGGDYEEKVDSDDVPDLQFTRIWDWYPDMTVTDHEKSEGDFERHIMNKHDLRMLMKRDDFYSDMITQFLTDHPNGNYVPYNWEVDLQVIEIEAGSGKGGSTRISGSTPIGDENDGRGTNRQLGKKYEVLEFWGYVDGSDLAACGLEIPDVTLEYACNVWLLGDKPIKAALFDTALDMYKVFYYEKDETSIFGEGLARVMRHSQLAIAGAARMVLDNGAVVSGPQVEVNWSLMTADTDLTSFYPRKVWFREGKGIDAQYPALRVYNIDSHIPELLSIIDAFKKFGDEETTLPTWMIGQMVNNETAQATSGRMATITISIKDVVRNFDAFTEKIIRDIYAWNMEFNPRPDIKGDFKCKARGVSSLVMKEIRMQALTQLTTTMTPEEWDYIPQREFLQEKFKAHDINITLLTEEEVQKKRQEREQSVQNQLALKMAEAEVQYKKAQTMAQLSKAKEHNVKATKEAQTPPEQPAGEDPRLVDGELELQDTEKMGKQAEIRRQEEKHAMDLAHADEAHTVKIATDTTKTAQELALKGKQAEHDMEMKEKMTKAGAEAKIIAAKKKPAPAKPTSKTKKG